MLKTISYFIFIFFVLPFIIFLILSNSIHSIQILIALSKTTLVSPLLSTKKVSGIACIPFNLPLKFVLSGIKKGYEAFVFSCINFDFSIASLFSPLSSTGSVTTQRYLHPCFSFHSEPQPNQEFPLHKLYTKLQIHLP